MKVVVFGGVRFEGGENKREGQRKSDQRYEEGDGGAVGDKRKYGLGLNIKI